MFPSGLAKRIPAESPPFGKISRIYCSSYSLVDKQLNRQIYVDAGLLQIKLDLETSFQCPHDMTVHINDFASHKVEAFLPYLERE